MSDYKLKTVKIFNELKPNSPNIACLIMVKDEQKRINVTLESIVGYVDSLVVYDTGSTDNTMEIIETFCENKKINLHLIQGIFVDYSTSRNILLKYADENIDTSFQLLMDCNDELRGGDLLKKFASMALNDKTTIFLICQQWKSPCSFDKYYNIRFIRSRSNIRYNGGVHEWAGEVNCEQGKTNHPARKIEDSIFLFQDRTQDDDKTGKRFFRDYEILLRDHIKNPSDSRTLFYLAQTAMCLKKYDETIYYSKLRAEISGFPEEIFHSYLRIAECSDALGHDWHDVLSYYFKSYELSGRIEPLIKISEHYIMQKSWKMAYMFLREACELEYPDNAILFVNKQYYDYQRWHLMGITGFYVNKMQEGRDACIKAVRQGNNLKEDRANLESYIKVVSDKK